MPSTSLDPTQNMDYDTSQGNMAAAHTFDTPFGTATHSPTSQNPLPNEAKPASNCSSLITSSRAPMSHPDSLVTLLVGPEGQRMVVHESYLSLDSAFFKAALSKQWIEGQTRVIQLPEESPEPMQHYMEFVYSGRVPTQDLTAEKMSEIDEKHCYDSLAHLYVLAERVLNPKCQNAIIREIFRLCMLECGSSESEIYPGTYAIIIIYQ